MFSLLSAALWPASASWAFDKAECVTAHERSQELWQQELLVQSREQLLICTDASCPALVRDDCDGWLSRVDKKLQLARPAQESRDRERTDHQTVVRMVEAAPQPATRDLSGGSHTAAAVDHGDGRPESTSWGFLRTPAVPATLSLLALVSGAYFGLRGLSEADHLRHSCAPDCTDAQVSDVRKELMIADVSTVLGVGFAVFTGWMLWQRAHAPTDERTVAAAAGWSATATASSLLLDYSRCF